MTIHSKTLALDTALGIVEVTVSIEGTDIAADIIALSIFPLNPELPLGMSVNECKAVLIQIGETRKSFNCLLYTSPSPRDKRQSRMPSSA